MCIYSVGELGCQNLNYKRHFFFAVQTHKNSIQNFKESQSIKIKVQDSPQACLHAQPSVGYCRGAYHMLIISYYWYRIYVVQS